MLLYTGTKENFNFNLCKGIKRLDINEILYYLTRLNHAADILST